MSLKRSQTFARVSIPEFHRLVIAGARKQSSVGTKGNCPHPTRVTLQRVQTFPSVDVPDLEGTIETRTRQNGSVGTEGNGEHPICVSSQDFEGLSRRFEITLP